jgi:hypothetical protein
MLAFSVPRDITVASRHVHRRIPAALPQDAAGGLDPAHVVIAIHDEDGLARQALGAEAERLRLYGEGDLSAWPSWPRRLGRLAPGPGGQPLTLIEAPAPLPAQLEALRARHPGKRHFRIALVGGFGGNLGDTLLGATAWRVVLPVLRAGLPGVAADILLGHAAHPAIPSLIGEEDGIGQIVPAGPSLQDFARYDAFFDFSDLITLPRFFDMAALDWLLWWMGLDPAGVPNAHKRNRLRLPMPAGLWARENLEARPGPRVAFVWRASTPLRSMPDATAARFAQDLLDAAPAITLVTDQPLPLRHPRLLDLGQEANSAERMMALVAQADGLVTVDSLAPHVADAADVPAVMLLASLPHSRFPHYPRMRIVTPPGMEALPGWGRTKVADEPWAGMREDYARAWETVSARRCWDLLADSMAARAGAARGPSAVDFSAVWPHQPPLLPQAGLPFPHDAPHPLHRWIDDEMARFAALTLRPGHTIVMASGDSHGLALALARRVAPGGALHVLEPRRLRAQKLCADVHAAGLDTLHPRPAQAGPAAGSASIPDFDPAGAADPAAWGNLLRTASVAVLPLDDLRLAECHLLVLRPPQDLRAALEGAEALLRGARPLVMAGPVPAADLDGLKRRLAPFDYACRLCWPNRGRIDAALVMAAPADTPHRFDGFEDF